MSGSSKEVEASATSSSNSSRQIALRRRRRWSLQFGAVTAATILALFALRDARAQPEAKIEIVPDLNPGGILTAAYSPDGGQFASGNMDDTIKLWSSATGRLIRIFHHGSPVTSLAFSLDGRRIAAGSYFGRTTSDRLKVWDVASGELIRSFKVVDVRSLAYSPDRRTIAVGHTPAHYITGGLAPALSLFDVENGQLVRAFTGHSETVNAVAFSSDGKRLLSASGNEQNPSTSKDNTIRIWDVTTGSILRTRNELSGPVLSAAFSHRHGWVISGGYDKVVKLRDAETLEPIKTFVGSPGEVTSVAFSSDDRRIISGVGKRAPEEGEDSVTVWEVDTGRQLATYDEQNKASLNSVVAFAPGDAEVLHVSAGGIKIWSAGASRSPLDRRKRLSQIDAVAMDKGPTRSIIAADRSNGLRVWDLESGQSFHTTVPPSSMISSVSISRDGKRMLTTASDGTLKWWEISTGKLVNAFGSWLDGNASALSYDDSLAASCGLRVQIWNASTGQLIKTLPLETNVGCQAIAISPDNRYLATGSEKLTLWNIGTGKAGWELKGPMMLGVSDPTTLSGFDIVSALAFDPTGKYLATGGLDGKVQLWDIADGRLVRNLTNHSGKVNSVVFSHDGKYVASGGFDNLVKVSDKAAGEIITLQGHSHAVSSVGFFSNDSGIVSGSFDGTVRMWCLELEGSAKANPFPIVLMASSADDWLVADFRGWFDAFSLEDVSDFSWIISDDPLRALSPEIFMRDYYEPRLLPRLLACHETEAKGDTDACKKAFKPVRPLAKLNRIQPEVKIVGVQRGASAGEVLVDVEVAGKEDPTQKNRKTKTDVYDLRLFRDGQIVGQWPEPRAGMSGAEDIHAWRAESKVPMADGQVKAVHRFVVHVPTRDKGQPVRLTAYAFNEDRVKSETASDESYKVPDDVKPAKPRAYVITVGVNAYQNPNWKLGFAVKDARDLSAALQQIQGYEVMSVPLVSIEDNGAKLDQATKANIEAALALLAGKDEPYRDRLVKAIGPDAEKLQKASPDDLVILAFSGHGYTDRQARFYLLPSDSGTDSTITDATLRKFISSDELSQWLREVDAGEMVMLIDACHSAASMPEGFKPGPMGDRGLGQLAYDKGMQILAATQADDVALESEKLGQGLLTYALVDDGLKARKAAPNSNGVITINSWLHYAEKRVPELYDEIQAGRLRVVGLDTKDTRRELVSKDPTIDPAFFTQLTKHAQTPALFDFYKQKYDPILK